MDCNSSHFVTLKLDLSGVDRGARGEPIGGGGVDHGRRTRMRASVNPAGYARFEGGTDKVADRLGALRRMADAGYRVGLTIAPIIATSRIMPAIWKRWM